MGNHIGGVGFSAHVIQLLYGDGSKKEARTPN
jgi:hypothetical protein